MTTSDVILAAMLLSAPVGTPESPVPPDQWPELRQSLRAVAIQWEILDERETGRVLSWMSEYQADLDLLRGRRLDLADAPHLADAARLPDGRDLTEAARFNRAYRQHLDARRLWEADRADAIAGAIAETDRLYLVWDAARDARNESGYVTARREALKRLKDALGPAAYARGDMPHCVPSRLFVDLPRGFIPR